MSSEDLFEQLRRSLVVTSCQIMGVWADAEDVLQATWLKWHQNHETVESPRVWLTKVTVRASFDGLRARQARRSTRTPSKWLPQQSDSPPPASVAAAIR